MPQERAQSLDELMYDLAKFGFKSDIVDLREYEEPEALKEKLEGYPVIWAAGGNTFILRSELERTGIDLIFAKLLEDSGIVYCGESAGAIVAGRSLEGADVGDDPDLADRYIGTGLGLVNAILAPHADSQEYVEYINHMKKLYPEFGQVMYLGDSQALIVDGGEQKIVSATG